jgi:putative holliday junction resolvase
VRLLGLDIGESRIGVAVSDPTGTVATPLTVLDSREVLHDPSQLARLVEEYEAAGLIVGLPLTMAGEEGPQAARIREHVDALSERLGIPVTLWDERLTTVQARRSLAEAGLDEREQRKMVDMVAASLILQSYLDARRGPDRPPDDSTNDQEVPS